MVVVVVVFAPFQISLFNLTDSSECKVGSALLIAGLLLLLLLLLMPGTDYHKEPCWTQKGKTGECGDQVTPLKKKQKENEKK